MVINSLHTFELSKYYKVSFLQAVFNFYINASIHVALAVCSLCGITFITANLEFNPVFFVFIFLSTITGYNFVKYAGIAKLYHKRLTHTLRSIQVFSFLAFVGLLYVAFLIPKQLIVICGLLALLTLLYALPIFPKEKSLRRFSGAKIYVIAIVWACTTALLPLIFNNEELKINDGLRFLQHFFFVLGITLPFEIRDLKYDSAALHTIPQQMGVRNTKLLGILLFLLVVLLGFMINSNHTFYSLATSIVALLSSSLLLKSNQSQSRYYTAFWVESLPIVWFVILVAIKILF